MLDKTSIAPSEFIRSLGLSIIGISNHFFKLINKIYPVQRVENILIVG
jgi:hypothetical protein